MGIKRNTKIDSSFSMASMSDMVFLLLIFFLVTTTLISTNALKLDLPKSTNQVSEKPMLTLSIKHYLEQGIYTYHIDGNANPISFSEVEAVVQARRPEIQARLASDERPVLSLYTDGSVPVEEVVKIMNIAKRNHYSLLLATRPE